MYHQAKEAESAYVHCTQTDKCETMEVVKISQKELVLYHRDSDHRMVLTRKDYRRPYVCTRGNMEFTVLDADIE